MSEIKASGQRELVSRGRRNQLGQAMGAKGMQTRRRLLEATACLLKTTPLRELRVAHIVRRAETSSATFYVYFNDVSEAVLALISELTQSPPSLLGLFDARWEPAEAMDRAHEFVASYVDHWEAHASLFLLRNLASDEGDERFGAVRLNAVAPLIGVMAERIQEGQRAGEAPADLHPQSAAGALLAMIERISGVRLDTRNKRITRSRLVRVAAMLSALLFARGDAAARILAKAPPAAADGRAETEAWIEEWISMRSRGPSGGASERLNLNGQEIGSKGSRTRQRMIEVTDDLLRRKPLLEISVAEIAAAARTSTSTFYLYFRDVLDVVLAAVAQVTQSPPELVALVKAPADQPFGLVKAHELVERYTAHWQEHRALFRVRNLASDEGDLRFVHARREAVRPLLEAVAVRIAERQALGALPQDIHPPSAASAILAMIERLAVIPYLPIGRNVTAETIMCAAARFSVVLLTGVEAWTDAPAGSLLDSGRTKQDR